MRTELYANPEGRFLADVILDACRRFSGKTALFDTSNGARFTYAEYGQRVEDLARGFIAAGLKPGEVVGIYLPNCWEFAATFHAASLAGAVPTLLNPSYREREVRYQLENSGAAFLVTDGPNMAGINLGGLPLRRVFTTRQPATGAESFASLFVHAGAAAPRPAESPQQTLAALPYSSGTTGLPKGVMLSHYNLISNVYQLLGPAAAPFVSADVVLCFLPLYHIYGLNVVLNPILALGATLVLMPRFHLPSLLPLLIEEQVTTMPCVPPVLNALCQAVEAGQFPARHRVRWVKSGAAPLAPELARRFQQLTGILINQGYGMTEASPVTHVGHIEPPALNRPASIGQPLALTECRVLDTEGRPADPGQPGELVMRGPQFMMGYWKDPEATAAVLRDGWYWSGDIVSVDAEGFYYVLDRRKEMIKYKGFPVAPAEVEAVLLEHPAVRDCGVVARPDSAAGEVPCAFVVLREGFPANDPTRSELCEFVAQRLTPYKQPREIHFVDSVPRTPSGKILRRQLRDTLVRPLPTA